LDRYLADWKNRTLEEIGDDRPGVREFFLNLAGSYGVALAHQVMRQLRAVYRYHQKVAPDLPECPTVVVELPPVTARDWALSDEELRQWWAAVQQLNPVKRMFWLTLLLTGARRGSVEALRWRDIDFDKRIVHFRVAKGGRTYSIPPPTYCLNYSALPREGSPAERVGLPFSPETGCAPGQRAGRQARRGKRASPATHLPNRTWPSWARPRIRPAC
jgi:integrase